MNRSLTGPAPEHLPGHLSISLWDFSWYTRAGDGEPYADLAGVTAEAASRGFTTVRICAAPLLLYGELGLDDLAADLEIEGMGAPSPGGFVGSRTRWYDVPGGYRVNLRERLFELLAAVRAAGMSVILSSWEYQQSPAFAASPRWFEAIDQVPNDRRYALLADSWLRLLDDVTAAGYRDLIAMVEMHNEVDFSLLPPLAEGMPEVTRLAAAHPDLLVTASYGKPPHLSMYEVPESLGAGQFHVYCYGVLDALQDELDIRAAGEEGFPNPALAEMLRRDAPPLSEYGRAAEWKYRATVVSDRMLYGYDWIDVEAWDRWLHERVGDYRLMMRREVESRVIAVARWARFHQVPVVIGEGWVGYTPLHGDFEESEEGRALTEHGIRTALAEGVWGVVLGSNIAPHHPSWSLVDWQRAMNRLIAEA
ncbi:cellulase-like family protein [Homoserinibacter sp. GY 40078]|uniref:cellulase-like family protein n=1 Tax=Homoserinibacter sp. GY 40078 TaxID=2603275 RepID=UPI002103358C|nr:cellulase-like family protein [Homoserinibacter sp. GY 40078]